ncbi:MAG: hypothetical protein D6706_17655 [Chloroflexi bacterium]|nr:MAG: hypothetical protein D6706_17655 [Chloroflexota bacterium]
MDKQKIQIGLALGGGVARGPAHVGVLSVLEEAGIPIHCVAGTSAGSIVGAAYCAGLTVSQMQELAQNTGWRDVARLAWPKRGFVSFAKMEPWLEGWLGKLDIRDLAIPFAAVVTDLESGEPVVLRAGRLATAVRASCSVPGVVTPVRINGRLYCDGGVSDNLPVSAVRELGADYVIGVDLFAPSGRLRWGPFGLGATALELLVRHAGGGVRQADCLIVPDISEFSYFRFSQSRQFIELGAQAARQALPKILADLKRLGVSLTAPQVQETAAFNGRSHISLNV